MALLALGVQQVTDENGEPQGYTRFYISRIFEGTNLDLTEDLGYLRGHAENAEIRLASMMKKLQEGSLPMSAQRFRFFNEVPTILLVSIVALAVFQSMVSYMTLLLVIVGLIAFIVVATMGYKRFRQKKAVKKSFE